MLLIYFGQEPNEINKFFFICCKIKEKKKLNTKEFFCGNNKKRKISEGYNLINGAKL